MFLCNLGVLYVTQKSISFRLTNAIFGKVGGTASEEVTIAYHHSNKHSLLSRCDSLSVALFSSLHMLYLLFCCIFVSCHVCGEVEIIIGCAYWRL